MNAAEKEPVINPLATTTADWENFAKLSNDNPDHYFCTICGQSWQTKEGRRGYNFCVHCGSLYSKTGLIHLSDNPMVRVKMICVVPVLVEVSVLRNSNRIPTPLFWSHFSTNKALLDAQGWHVEKHGDQHILRHQFEMLETAIPAVSE